jgi:hypothetical protein
MTQTPSFIFAIEEAFTIPFVSGVSGVWKVMKSARRYSSSRDTVSTPRRLASSFDT